ncbi:MAG: hypothetical protein P8L31_08490 [Pseudomonadales bacterium]|nr:hypothetical protein [Pseudomonadales bacterium]
MSKSNVATALSALHAESLALGIYWLTPRLDWQADYDVSRGVSTLAIPSMTYVRPRLANVVGAFFWIEKCKFAV